MEKPDLVLQFLRSRIGVVNVGLEGFADHLRVLGVDVIQVDWRPPAEGNPELLRKLKRLAE